MNVAGSRRVKHAHEDAYLSTNYVNNFCLTVHSKMKEKSFDIGVRNFATGDSAVIV